MGIKVGFSYPVKFVQTKTTSRDQMLTTFKIGDKIKGSPTNQFQNYEFTLWDEHLDISDNDKFKVSEIISIDCKYYNGKLYYKITGKGEKVAPNYNFENESAGYNISDKPTTKTIAPASKPQEDFVALTIDEDELPFDLS